MDSPDSVLAGINRSLQDGWQAKLNQDGRLFYLDHNSRTAQWIPPPTCWFPKGGGGMPYGWEGALDKNGKHYYINHVTCTTTREDPFDVENIPPVEREITLVRDPMLGFGFIAGSEKPVVVRSVTEGGPSVGKLLPGDKILRLNGEDVKMKDGPYIIERIRQSSETIRLAVIQPYIDKTGLKSSFLSANKKQKLKSRPSRVRFADNVKAAEVAPGQSQPSLVYLPSVLKVYLENGQTKSFRYDNKTTVKEVLRNLRDKLALRSMEHFSLVVLNMEESAGSTKYTILQEEETLAQIATRPGSQQWKCLLRVTFAPQDAYDLLSRDAKAFDYFYLQCCNDIIGEKFAEDLDSERTVRLAALQIQQHFLSSKQSAKVSLKALEREDGVERFLPPSVVKQTKPKELRRLINHHLKQSQGLCAPGQKHLTELQAKLHYLKIVCDLRSFGGMYFSGTMVGSDGGDSSPDYHCTVLVGPKCGVSEVISQENNVTSRLADFSQLTGLQLSPAAVSGDCLRLELHVKNEQPIVLRLTHDDAYDMVTLVNGYYRLFVDSNHSLLPSHYSHSQETEAPAYRSRHRVVSADWNYPNDLVSELICGAGEGVGNGRPESRVSRVREGEHMVDLSSGPPSYQEDVAYINRLKSEGRFHLVQASGGQPDGAVMAFTIQEEGEEEEEEEEEGEGLLLHRNANNSLDQSLLSKSDSSSVSEGDLYLDLNPLSDLVEEMFELRPAEVGGKEAGLPGPAESRQEMTIDGADEKQVFREVPSEEEEEEKSSGADQPRPSQTERLEVSDTVALSPPPAEEGEQTAPEPVKMLHYAIYNDDSLIPVREICQTPCEEEDVEGGTRSGEEWATTPPDPPAVGGVAQRAKILPQDSLVLALKKTLASHSDALEEEEEEGSGQNPGRGKKVESFRNLSSYSLSSVDSDIVDLTQISPADSPVKGEDQPCSRVQLEIPPFDLSTVYSGEDDEHAVQEPPAVGREVSDSPVPVSIIDLPSPDPDSEEEDTSHQAHGVQLTALDSINVRVAREQDESARREPECESDSGNETISSEIIDNGVSDEPGASHSPCDYFSLIGRQQSPAEPAADRDPTPTPEHQENKPEQEQDGSLHQPGCPGSDTDSISTLHGSSPNLSTLDAPPDQPGELWEREESVDDLIAAFIIPPPPALDSVELDEELLSAVIPPPPVSDFDIGVIEALIVPPPPGSLPASPPPPRISPKKSPRKSPDPRNLSESKAVKTNQAIGQEPAKKEVAPESKTRGRLEDVQASPSASPRSQSPVKWQAVSPAERTCSPIKSNPSSPCKVQAATPSASEPQLAGTKWSRPRKISSSTMSSSQDSGFCQPGPGDPDAPLATFHEGVEEEARKGDPKSFGHEKQTDHAQFGEDCRDKEVDTTTKDLDGNAERLEEVEDREEPESDAGSALGSVERPEGPTNPAPDVVDHAVIDDEPEGPTCEPQESEPLEQPSPEAPVSKPPLSKPVVPPKPAARAKITRQDSVDSLSGGDFDTSGSPEDTRPKKTSPQPPKPPPRKRYSPGLAKKAYPVGSAASQELPNGLQRSSSLKITESYGEYLQPFDETVHARSKPSSSDRVESRPPNQSSTESDDSEPTTNGKSPLRPQLSADLELRQAVEFSRPITRSNTFSAGCTSDSMKPKRKAPPPPPKPARLKKKASPSSDKSPVSPREKQSFRNTISSSSPSSLTKLLSPKRSFSFLRGSKSLAGSKGEESVLPSSATKEKKEFRRPRPLRAFRSLSRKDSYDVSMLDTKRSGDVSFKESSSLRVAGGLQRPTSLPLGNAVGDSEMDEAVSVSKKVSQFETQSKWDESGQLPPAAADGVHVQLRQSQSLSRASGRPVSSPGLLQKYPGPGSIHASLPKRPPPPRPHHPPASPRKAMYPSDESLSSSSSDAAPSPVPLPSPSGYDRDSTDSDDVTSPPPPLPISLPPVRSRPRALPELFVPPADLDHPGKDGASAAYMVELESKEYLGKHSIPEALGDIQLLIAEFRAVVQAEVSAPSLRQFRQAKESLLSEVREFTSNTKMLVGSAGQSEEQLVRSLNASVHTLARLASDTQQMMRAMVSTLQAANLGNKIKEVATNFSSTLSAAAEAHGRSLNHPSMQLLLRHAQTMAAILSALMRTLRMLQS